VIKRKWPTFAIAALCFVAIVLFGTNPSPSLQLVSMGSMLVLMVVLIRSAWFAVTTWKEFKAKAVVPLVVCILVVPAALTGASLGRMVHFAFVLPVFERLVEDARRRDIPPGSKPIELSSSLAYLVLAERTNSGALQVEFLTGRGYPVRHTGYLYADSGAVDPDSVLGERWPSAHGLRRQWFRIAD
jgi:hypothetical protein